MTAPVVGHCRDGHKVRDDESSNLDYITLGGKK